MSVHDCPRHTQIRSGVPLLFSFLAFAVAIAPASAQYTIKTVAGGGQPPDSLGDGGPATGANINYATGVGFDTAGNLYVADAYSRVRKISANGTITTVAGGGPCCALGDGAPATSANLSEPLDVVVDSAGNMFIADLGDRRVRKVDTSGIITTYAGGGSQFLSTGVALPATTVQLRGPNSLVLDASGNLYFADAIDNTGGVVYRVTPDGGMTIAAGGLSNLALSPGSGDGGLATSAFLFLPAGLALDSGGNLYIVDAGTNRVRKVSTNSIITTFAGSGSGSYSGDGGTATQAGLNLPEGVAVDSAGNVYISDTDDERIRMVTPGGTITTIAGDGVQGFSGDGGPANQANLSSPKGVSNWTRRRDLPGRFNELSRTYPHADGSSRPSRLNRRHCRCQCIWRFLRHRSWVLDRDLRIEPRFRHPFLGRQRLQRQQRAHLA